VVRVHSIDHQIVRVVMVLCMTMKSTAVTIRIGVLMNMCEGRLHEGKTEHTRHEDAKEAPHPARTNLPRLNSTSVPLLRAVAFYRLFALIAYSGDPLPEVKPFQW
jgi:hypothetical protein